jgi:Arc/MetJ family transcription regulator
MRRPAASIDLDAHVADRRVDVPLQRVVVAVLLWRRPPLVDDRGVVASSLASSDASFGVEDSMRTTVKIDDELLAKASAFTGIKERSALLREGLKTLIRVESARRLAALGGSDSRATAAPRRRGGAA